MDQDHMVVRDMRCEEVNRRSGLGKTFKDEFTLGVTSVAVNDE